MISSTNTGDLFGATVRDRSGAKVGSVGQVFVDPDDASPLWATVKTGLFGTHESFVPLDAAELRGEDLVVPYDEHLVKAAPRIDTDGSLTEDETERLYEYYGIGGQHDADAMDTGGRHVASGEDRIAAGPTPDASGTAGAPAHVGPDVVDADRTAGSTDGAMTRSEEQLRVGTRRVASRRVRLEKVTVTEMKTITVPVSHEEVRLVEVPLGDDDAVVGTATEGTAPGNVADPSAGTPDAEEPHDLILTEERVVVSTERVPVERVRLATDVVTEDQEISETVRRERIALEQTSGTDPVQPPTDGGPAASTGRES